MSAEVTLTEAEREALDIAVIDDRDRQEGYAVLGPGGTDGQTPTLHEAVERIVAARVEQARAEARDEGHRFTGYKPGRGDNPYREAGPR